MSTPFEIPEWLFNATPAAAPPVDPYRIEGLVNRVIAAKQEALFDAPDAFYRREAADALDGAPAIGQRLQALRASILDQAADDGERAALGARLDAHIDDALDGIGRHVAAQRTSFERQTVTQRQALIRRAVELEPDNDDKIAGLAEAHASAAQDLARLDGLAAGSPEESGVLTAARSHILRAAIEQRIAASRPDHAVTLYDRVKATLSPADLRALEVPMGVATDDAVTDAWLARETQAGGDGAPIDGRALDGRIRLDDTLSEMQRHILQAKIAARDSAEESRRAADRLPLDDRRAEAITALATQPSRYRIGTLARRATAYDEAGAPDRAAETHRLGLLEPLFLPFAQLGVETQQRHLATLDGPARAFAEEIMRRQEDAFARDPYAAGTTLYPEVGPPLPEEDAAGRLKQVRMIEARHGNSIQTRTQNESTEAQAALSHFPASTPGTNAPSDDEISISERNPTSIPSPDIERSERTSSDSELASLPTIGRPDNDNRTPEELCQRAFDDMRYELLWGYDSSGNLLTPNDKKLWIERGVVAREDCLRIARNGFIPRDGAYVHYPGGGIVIFRPNRSPIYVPPSRYRPPR